MKKNLFSSGYLLLLVFACKSVGFETSATANFLPTTVQFQTSDSITIYGDLFKKEKSANIILLFHQGGSNARAEYSPIIPKLTAKGWNVLAIDQRLGGQTYGSYNRTVAEIPINEFGYCDAYRDLEAALSYVQGMSWNGKIIVWGSSYSASLAIQLANEEKGKIHGVLAFSPASGGPMADCKPDPFFASLEIPLLLLRPAGEMQIESVQQQFQLAQQNQHQTYVAENGTHGSSMLVEERVGKPVEKNWEVVYQFLSGFK